MIILKKVLIIILTIIFLLLAKQTVIADQTTNMYILEEDDKDMENNETDNSNNQNNKGRIQLSSRDDFKNRKYRVERLTVTAYAPFDNKSGICNDGDPTKTATGTYPKHGTVAVNPKRFPYGTKFYIPGYSYGVAEDTGGAMRRDSSKIDVFMSTYDEAISWGVRVLDVIVFDDD